MTSSELIDIVTDIVRQANDLKNARTDAHDAPVNYACVFCQNDAEFKEMSAVASTMGSVAKDTLAGQVFRIEPIETVAGPLLLLKIRKPDPARPERGDADFTVRHYAVFRKKYFGKPGFKLIERPDMEMIELVDPAYPVLAYFSHPTLIELLSRQA